VPGGFEQLSRAALEEAGLVAPVASCSVPVPAPLALGYSAGVAGGVHPILVSTEARPLPTSALCSPVVSVALAHISLSDDVADLDGMDGSAAVASLVALLRESRPAWTAALACWVYHSGRGTNAPLSFRVATVRGGKHAASSRAFDGALGSLVCEWHPDWSVDLRRPDVMLLCIVLQRRALLGLVLPPFTSKPSDAMPSEPRRSLVAGLDRPHMRPSRAAALVLLLAPIDGEVILDPCGGIGLLAIAATSAVRANSLSIYLSIDRSIDRSIYIHIYLSISIHPSMHPLIHPSIDKWMDKLI